MVAGGFLLVFAAVAGTALAQGDFHPPDAPEIDPGSAMSAISLLAGGMLLLADKVRRKK